MSDASSPSSDSPSEPSSAPLRRWGRRVGWTVAGLLVSLLLAVGGLLLILQTESGATAAAQWVASTANPLPGTRLTVERASGSWLRSLRLTNVTLARTDSATGTSVPMAHVDTLTARYRLLPLLQGRVHVTSVDVAGPAVTARQAPDSTWDWSRVLPAGTDETAADTSAGLAIRLDRVRVADGSFAAAFHTERGDSTARVHDLQVRAHDIESAASVTAQLDTLGLRAQLPGAQPDLSLAARGGLSDSTLTVDLLQLDSPRSAVHGHGSVRLPTAAAPADDVQFQLRAAPFALADLTPFVPGLDVDPSETVRLDLTVGGSGELLTATADARFSTGGTLSASVAATPTTTPATFASPQSGTGAPSQAALQYRLDATVRSLTTSLLGPVDSTQNRLNGRVRANLRGPTLSALSGPVDLHLSNTRWASFRTSLLSLTSTFRDGTATLDLTGNVNDTPLTVTGRATPLADAPTATLTARVEALNVANFASDAGLESALSAAVDVKAQALGTDAQTLDATLRLDSSRVGRQPIAGGTVTTTLSPDRAELDGRLALPDGAVTAVGSVAFDGSNTFALAPLRLDNVNPVALLGDTTASRVSGTLEVQGRGFAPDSMTVDADLALSDSYYGPYRLSTLRTTATLADARLTSTTNATLNGSQWELGLQGRPFAQTPTVELTKGRFTALNVGAFAPDTAQTSTLQGTLQGRVRGFDPATMTADARLSLDSSRVNEQTISSATLALRLRDAQLDTDLQLTTPEGGTQLRATVRPFDEVPTVQVTEGTFDNLNVGAWAGLPDLTTALSGSVTMDGKGATAETAALDARLSFAPSQINDASLSEGALTLSVGQGRVQTDGHLEIGEGRVRLSGQVDSLATTPAYRLETTAGRLDVAPLAGLDSLTARLDTLRWTLEGRGTDPKTLTTTTTLTAGGVTVDQFTLDALTVTGQLRRGQLALDTLGVTANAFTGTGTGTLAVTDSSAASDFSFRATVTDTAPLQSLIGARRLRLSTGRFEARIYGSSLANQRFDGEVTLKSLLYDDVRLADAELNFNGQRGDTQLLRRLEVQGTLGYASLPSIAAEQTEFEATYDGTATTLTTTVRFDPTHTASLDAQVRTDSTTTTVTLRSLNATLGPDKWSLLQEATITAGDQYRIRGLLLHSGSQQVAVDGIVDPQGTQSLVTTIESVRLGAISPLAGLSGLDGRLSGSLVLEGAATAPRLTGGLSLNIRSENKEVGTLNLDVGYEDLALTLDTRLTHADGSVLTATGTYPIDLRLRAPTPANVADRPVQFDFSTDRFPVDWVDPFLDPATVRDVQGVLTADVTVRGTLADPNLSGTASLAGGGADLPPLETRYRDAAASLRFADDQLTLERAVLYSSNDGRLRANGVINFPELTVGEYDLRLQAADFIAIDTRSVRRAVIDGDMTLRGTLTRPVLDGSVDVNSANIYYNELLAESETAATAVPLTEEDQLTLENRFGLRLSSADTTTFDAYEAMAMNLTVTIQRNTWLRSESNPELNVQFTGDLDVSKAPDKDPQVFGSIEVVSERSTLRQFGQEFQITEGTLTFNGDPYTPYLALQAVYEQRARGTQGTEVRITLGLKGRPDDLTPTLSSEPPMDTRNILSYLATGRPADELLDGGEEGGNFATQMALGQASNFVENLAASELGLDVVRVELRASGDSYLTVGRYFSPRFFVSLQQPVTTSNLNSLQTAQYLPDLTLEYQLLDTLMLRVLNNQQSFNLNLLFEYAY